MFDMGTDWKEVYPTAMRTTEETVKALQHFQGSEEKVKSFYCDNAPELKAACAELKIINPTSTPACPETNGIAESNVKEAKQGTTCNMVASGFESSWWEPASTCWSFQTNITARARWPGEKKASAYERRHSERCRAELIPFGAMVEFMKTPFPQNKPAPFSEKATVGLMVGYEVHPGGRWAGDYHVVEYEPLRANPDITFRQMRRHIHRIKEVWMVRDKDRQIRYPLGERKRAIARLPPELHVVAGDSIFNNTDNYDQWGGHEDDGSADNPGQAEGPAVAHPPVDPAEVLATEAGAPGTYEAFINCDGVLDDNCSEIGGWSNRPAGGIGPIDRYRQPDTRGEAGWAQGGEWVRKYKGSQRPPHINPKMWTLMSETHGEEIKQYLDQLRAGTYVNAEGPGEPAAPARRRRPQGRGKQGPYTVKAKTDEARAAVCGQIPLRIVVLEDGPDTKWGDALRGMLHTTNKNGEPKELLDSYDMSTRTAEEVITVLDTPGTAVIMHAGALTGPLHGCRDSVRRYLFECDKVIRHVAKMGGFINPHSRRS